MENRQKMSAKRIFFVTITFIYGASYNSQAQEIPHQKSIEMCRHAAETALKSINNSACQASSQYYCVNLQGPESVEGLFREMAFIVPPYGFNSMNVRVSQTGGEAEDVGISVCRINTAAASPGWWDAEAYPRALLSRAGGLSKTFEITKLISQFVSIEIISLSNRPATGEYTLEITPFSDKAADWTGDSSGGDFSNLYSASQDIGSGNAAASQDGSPGLSSNPSTGEQTTEQVSLPGTETKISSTTLSPVSPIVPDNKTAATASAEPTSPASAQDASLKTQTDRGTLIGANGAQPPIADTVSNVGETSVPVAGQSAPSLAASLDQQPTLRDMQPAPAITPSTLPGTKAALLPPAPASNEQSTASLNTVAISGQCQVTSTARFPEIRLRCGLSTKDETTHVPENFLADCPLTAGDMVNVQIIEGQREMQITGRALGGQGCSQTYPPGYYTGPCLSEQLSEGGPSRQVVTYFYQGRNYISAVIPTGCYPQFLESGIYRVVVTDNISGGGQPGRQSIRESVLRLEGTPMIGNVTSLLSQPIEQR